MKYWYALQTRHNHEQAAAAALVDRKYNSYCPMTLVDKRKIQNVEKPKFIEPLFPRYIFVYMNEGVDDFHPIIRTPGVLKIVKMTKRDDGYLYPTRIPTELIEALQALEDEEGIHSNYKLDYEPGDHVMVVRGVFKDFPAEIHSMDSNQRAIVLINFFNSVRQVKVGYLDIVPV